MRPRTVLLLVCLILGLGLAVRWAIAWAGFIPKPTDYRKATQLTVTYRLKGQPKRVVISQSQQLAPILDGIQVYSRDESRSMGRPTNSCVCPLGKARTACAFQTLRKSVSAI